MNHFIPAMTTVWLAMTIAFQQRTIAGEIRFIASFSDGDTNGQAAYISIADG